MNKFPLRHLCDIFIYLFTYLFFSLYRHHLNILVPENFLSLNSPWKISERNIFQNDSLIELSSEGNVVIDSTSENRESIGGYQPISRERRDKEAEKEDGGRREKRRRERGEELRTQTHDEWTPCFVTMVNHHALCAAWHTATKLATNRNNLPPNPPNRVFVSRMTLKTDMDRPRSFVRVHIRAHYHPDAHFSAAYFFYYANKEIFRNAFVFWLKRNFLKTTRRSNFHVSFETFWKWFLGCLIGFASSYVITRE